METPEASEGTQNTPSISSAKTKRNINSGSANSNHDQNGEDDVSNFSASKKKSLESIASEVDNDRNSLDKSLSELFEIIQAVVGSSSGGNSLNESDISPNIAN